MGTVFLSFKTEIIEVRNFIVQLQQADPTDEEVPQDSNAYPRDVAGEVTDRLVKELFTARRYATQP